MKNKKQTKQRDNEATRLYLETEIRPGCHAEYIFHPTRRWRLDFAWPSDCVAIEIEGGIWIGGRHTRPVGYAKDMEKYNEAQRLGWKVFRFTPTQLKKGIVKEYMTEVFNGPN